MSEEVRTTYGSGTLEFTGFSGAGTEPIRYAFYGNNPDMAWVDRMKPLDRAALIAMCRMFLEAAS